eukprot:5692628-Pyramimonas_sp.AAC.1
MILADRMLHPRLQRGRSHGDAACTHSELPSRPSEVARMAVSPHSGPLRRCPPSAPRAALRSLSAPL